MKTSARITTAEEIASMETALRELILVREKLIATMESAKSKVAIRRLKAAQRALGRQAQSLAVGLLDLGASRLEVGSVIMGTKKEATVLNSAGLKFELSS